MDVPEESPERAPSAQPEPAASAPGDPSLRLRASDADRDRVADQLRDALAEGRLNPEEHAERLDAVYAAKTYAELTPIVADLPGTGEPAGAPWQPAMPVASGAGASVPAPAHQAGNIVAIFSGADRKGRWLVEPRTTVLTVFGGVDLDLRQAVLSQQEVTINITCVFGGVQITVPPGVRVINSVAAVFGGCQLPSDDPLEPDAPVIRLTGITLFGGIDVKRRAAGPATAGTTDAAGAVEGRERLREVQRDFHERRREARRDLRDNYRELRDLRRSERHQRRRGR